MKKKNRSSSLRDRYFGCMFEIQANKMLEGVLLYRRSVFINSSVHATSCGAGKRLITSFKFCMKSCNPLSFLSLLTYRLDIVMPL